MVGLLLFMILPLSVLSQDDPCNNYSMLYDDGGRSINCDRYYSESHDRFIDEGWRRVQLQSTGEDLTMPTQCIPHGYCGSHSNVWLNGTYPTVKAGIVNRTGCVSMFSSCCKEQYPIQIKNCTDYMVYNLMRTLGSDERYCFGDSTLCYKTSSTTTTSLTTKTSSPTIVLSTVKTSSPTTKMSPQTILSSTTKTSPQTILSLTTKTSPQTILSSTTKTSPQTILSSTTKMSPQTILSSTTKTSPQTILSSTTKASPQTILSSTKTSRPSLWTTVSSTRNTYEGRPTATIQTNPGISSSVDNNHQGSQKTTTNVNDQNEFVSDVRDYETGEMVMILGVCLSVTTALLFILVIGIFFILKHRRQEDKLSKGSSASTNSAYDSRDEIHNDQNNYDSISQHYETINDNESGTYLTPI